MKFFDIIKANKEVTELSTKVEGLVTENKQLQEAVANYKQKEAAYTLGVQEWATEKQALIEGHANAVKTLTEKFEEEKKNLELKAKQESEKAGEKASAIVASLGVEPDAVKIVAKTDLVNGGSKSRYTVTVR